MSESAAQKVFNLLDLVEIICEYTSERGPDGGFLDKKPLRSLAMVNQVARHSAFRRLWRNVNGLGKIMDRVAPERTTRIKKPASVEEFFFFTDMVHSFHAWSYGDCWGRLAKLEQFVARLPSDRQLFPNLEDLGLPWCISGVIMDEADGPWSPPPRTRWTTALSVFPPRNIRKLSLHLSGINLPEEAPLMASIGTRFPLLSTLDISNTPIESGWKMGISNGIRAIPNLRKLEINLKPSIITAFVADLTYLRALRTLHIELRSGEAVNVNEADESKERDSDSRHPTSSLRLPLDLLLTGHNNAGQVCTVVSALGANRVPLASLSVIMDSQAHTNNTLVPITELVASTYPSISHLTLQYYNLSTEERYSRNLANAYHRLLIPLLPLSSIVELDLRVSGTMVLDKNTLQAIPDYWPSIQYCHFSLEICPSQTKTGRTPPQLLDVVNFASRCHTLKTLGIALDARVPSTPEEIPEMSSQTLGTLNVGSSSIDHSRYAATLIRTAFPSLVDLLWTKETHPRTFRMTDQERDIWKSVHRLVFSPA